jgi:hypothetical protein
MSDPQVNLDGPYNLTIKLLSATLTRDTDLVGKMEPFPMVEFTRAGQTLKFKGPSQKDADKEPVWNWELVHHYGGEVLTKAHIDDSTVKISVWEEDLTKNELIGETKALKLSEIAGKKKLALEFEGKPAGEVNIEGG